MFHGLAVSLIWDAYEIALKKHPGFVSEFTAMVVIGEEFGEACRAVIDGKREEAKRELAHTGAMVLRALTELFPD